MDDYVGGKPQRQTPSTRAIGAFSLLAADHQAKPSASLVKLWAQLQRKKTGRQGKTRRKR
jgi:hypothetical protein